MNETTDLFRQAQQAQFDLLLDQLKQLDEWMVKDFPEVDFKVKIDSHVDENRLTVELTFLTANEMSPNDRLFKKLSWYYSEEVWNNPNTMAKINNLSEKLKQTISNEINKWYARRKEADGAL